MLRAVKDVLREIRGIGTRKLAVQLLKDGYQAGRKLIRRLMQQMGLSVIYPKPNLSKKDPNSVILPYLLRNPRELRKAIDLYVEQYNNVRPHESLGYDTPDSCFGDSVNRNTEIRINRRL